MSGSGAVKLALRFDPEPLQRDVAGFDEEDWLDHFVKRNYEGSWSVIPLRGPRGAEHPVMMMYSDPTCSDFADTPFLARAPHVRDALDQFACELQSVRLMRLAPGSVIKEHRDLDLSLEDGMVRLHVPITTNSEVEFRLSGDVVPLAEGECWYLPLAGPHSVRNGGERSRVHLVLDALPNAWLRAQITGVTG